MSFDVPRDAIDGVRYISNPVKSLRKPPLQAAQHSLDPTNMLRAAESERGVRPPSLRSASAKNLPLGEGPGVLKSRFLL